MKKLLLILIGVILLSGCGLPNPPFGADIVPLVATTTISSLLLNKTVVEKSNIKAAEISKINFKGRYTDIKYGIEVEILSLVKIESGIEIMARAWKDGKQLGFGEDGSVDIERFRIYNPPILIDDPNGNIIRNSINPLGIVITRKMKENPVVAVKNALAHIILVAGIENGNIVKGKIGNTTSTFYPTIDGHVNRNVAAAENWTTRRSGAGEGVVTDGTYIWDVFRGDGTAFTHLNRALLEFNASAIADTDTINSVTISFFGVPDQQYTTTVASSTVAAGTTATNGAIVMGDYQSNVGPTLWTNTTIPITSFSTVAYNDFPLNAAGIAGISKTSVTKFVFLTDKDQSNTSPAVTLGYTGSSAYALDQTGTDKDPMLVVVHSAAVAPITPSQLIIFE